jgi:quercetin dioxygenase-like cupin family protein
VTPVEWLPTAVHAVGAVHDTPKKLLMSPAAAPGSRVAWTDHALLSRAPVPPG